MGVQVGANQGTEGEGYAHLDFSDVPKSNVHLNSLYDSRRNVIDQMEVDSPTYGNLEDAGAGVKEPMNKKDAVPYVNLDPTQQADDDFDINGPMVSLDPAT